LLELGPTEPVELISRIAQDPFDFLTLDCIHRPEHLLEATFESTGGSQRADLGHPRIHDGTGGERTDNDAYNDSRDQKCCRLNTCFHGVSTAGKSC
jgi:hypothetical protein